MGGHAKANRSTETEEPIAYPGKLIPTGYQRSNVIDVRRSTEGVDNGVETEVPKEETGGPPMPMLR